MAFKRPSRRALIISLVSVIIVLAAGAYTWASISAWKGYEARLTAEQATLEKLRDQALGADAADKRLAAIRELDDRLKGRDDLCDMNPLFAWQSAIVPVLKDGVQRCQNKVKALGAVAGPLTALRQYLDVAQKVQQRVKALAPEGNLTDANWSEQGLNRAQQLRADLKKISAQGDAQKLKDQAGTLADNLVKSWKSLIEANGKKDKDGFLAASAAVVKSYADFAGLADTADDAISGQVTALQKAAAKL